MLRYFKLEITAILHFTNLKYFYKKYLCSGKHLSLQEMILYFDFQQTFFYSIRWFGLVSLFNGISTLFRLFNAKAILLEEQ